MKDRFGFILSKKTGEKQMILTLTEVSDFKRAFSDRFSADVHFCDSCGGQSFAVENPTEQTRQFIAAYFAERKMTVFFSENGEYFSVRKNLS